jgi:hypothetical protein
MMISPILCIYTTPFYSFTPQQFDAVTTLHLHSNINVELAYSFENSLRLEKLGVCFGLTNLGFIKILGF